MKRIAREKKLSPEQIEKYSRIREQVEGELPELTARHHDRMTSIDQVGDLLMQLKAEREAKGLSLADLTNLTGMD